MVAVSLPGVPAAGQPPHDEAPPKEATVLTPADVDEEDIARFSIRELLDMPLESLVRLDMRVGSITESRALSIPASVTTITEEDIRLTPARNLLDLMEVYVPGLSWAIHSEGPHPGIRGIISDRNYKFLLLVNGRLLNQKAHAGVVTELENWDLNDIAQIDVLRGPGSVTYGPGAIAGVISITTKSARKYDRTALRVGYVAPYQSARAAFETAFRSRPFEVYAYASVVGTRGIEPRNFTVDPANNAGYLFESPAFPDRPAAYLGDYSGHPQVKAYLDVRFFGEWTFWARYTSSGSSAGSSARASDAGTANRTERFVTGFTPDGAPIFGPPESVKQLQGRQLTVTLANEHRFGNVLTLKSMLSAYTLDWRRRVRGVSVFKPTDPPELRNALTDRDGIRLFAHKFAEDEVFARVIANLRFHSNYRAALGVEWAYDRWRPAWGDNRLDFRMGDNSEITSGTDSHAFGFPEYQGVDPTRPWLGTSGWDTHTGSALGEVDARFHRLFALVLSGRGDKNEYSKLVLSPRVAVVSEITENNVIKLIWQRAQRLNTAEQLFYQKKITGTLAQPEVLQSFEAIFTSIPARKVGLSASAFYNAAKLIGWNAARIQSIVVGDLKLAGTEVEAAYVGPRLRAGLNHSFVKQVKWKLASGITQSGISYADYNQPTADDPTIVIKGHGNDLSNWSNNATKLFVHARLRSRLVIHLDGRVFWGWQGQKDGLEALEVAAQGSSREAAIARSMSIVRAEGAYGADFRLNASAQIALDEGFTLNVYGMNLLGTGGFKRYAYDTGNSRAAPVRTQFIREPLTVGVTVTRTW